MSYGDNFINKSGSGGGGIHLNTLITKGFNGPANKSRQSEKAALVSLSDNNRFSCCNIRFPMADKFEYAHNSINMPPHNAPDSTTIQSKYF